jgi:hypothetical protein
MRLHQECISFDTVRQVSRLLSGLGGHFGEPLAERKIGVG